MLTPNYSSLALLILRVVRRSQLTMGMADRMAVKSERNKVRSCSRKNGKNHPCVLHPQVWPQCELSLAYIHFAMVTYLATQFPWSAVRNLHAAALFEIECGLLHWGDSFAHLEAHLFHCPANLSQSSRRFSFARLFKPESVLLLRITMASYGTNANGAAYLHEKVGSQSKRRNGIRRIPLSDPLPVPQLLLCPLQLAVFRMHDSWN